jgi:hypothetical protein
MPLNTTEAPDFLEITRSNSTENLPQENLFVHARTAPLSPEKEWEEHDDSIASSPTPGSGAQDEESQRARRVSHRATWWPLPGTSIVSENQKEHDPDAKIS